MSQQEAIQSWAEVAVSSLMAKHFVVCYAVTWEKKTFSVECGVLLMSYSSERMRKILKIPEKCVYHYC